MIRALLNTRELAAKLGYSADHLYRLKRTKPHFLTQFEARLPLGCERQARRYSRELVDRFLAGEPLPRIGAGSRTLRRVS